MAATSLTMKEQLDRDIDALLRHADDAGDKALVDLIHRTLRNGVRVPSRAARRAYLTLVKALGLDGPGADSQD